MKHFRQKAAALLMAAALCVSMSTPASAAVWTDMPTDDSGPAMEAAVSSGLLRGDSDGLLRPESELTRVELAAIVVRAFGADRIDVDTDLSGCSDVPQDAWYYGELGRAVAMGLMSGSGRVNPDSPATRQEVFTLLAQALCLEDGPESALEGFSDAGLLDGRAVGPVAAMAKAGYVKGGELDPDGAITRAQFAQLMTQIFPTVLNEAGTYTKVERGNVMVSAGGVTLKGVTISGDLVIGDGVGDGDVTLSKVTVQGRVIVRGGGRNSIHLNDSNVQHVIVEKKLGENREETRLEGGGRVSTVRLSKGVSAVIDMPVGTLSVEEDVEAEIGGNVDEVHLQGSDVTLTLGKPVLIRRVNVDAGLENLWVSTTPGSTVWEMVSDSDLVYAYGGAIYYLWGSGTVTDENGELVRAVPPYHPSDPVSTPTQPSLPDT